MEKRKAKNLWKKSMATLLGVSMVASVLPGQQVEVSKASKESQQDVMVIQNNASGSIKNVIYMIPDGGGLPSYDIAKSVKAAGGVSYAGTKQTSNKMYMDGYLVGNYSTDPYYTGEKQVTDSAAAGTALATGQKTFNGSIGVDKNSKPRANLLEMSQLQNKATGLVVTTYTSDATPAAFSSHVSSRSSDAEIIKQMTNQNLNVVLGASVSYHSSSEINTIKNSGYQYITNKSDMYSAGNKTYSDASEQVKLWADYNSSSHHMSWDMGIGKNLDGSDDTGKKVPTIGEMTDTAIKLLSQDQDGFFLMVEGSKIDYANHHRNMTESATEWIAFDEAFKVALDYAMSRNDTMIVVAPDHNTGLVETPNGDNMNKVIDKVKKQKGKGEFNSCAKFATYDDSDAPHTDMNCGLWVYAPDGTESLDQILKVDKNAPLRGEFTIENTQVANYVAAIIADGSAASLDDATEQLFYEVTSLGNLNGTTFKFKDYNASVEINTDKVTVNGEQKSAKGQISVSLNDRVFVSKYAYQLATGNVAKNDMRGQGTEADPYQIKDEDDFKLFIKALTNGDTFAGKYVKQYSSIDVSRLANYSGLGTEASFAGNYDGQGHTITVALDTSTAKGMSIFPYVTGSVRNLGTQGSMKNQDSKNGECAGIAYAVRKNGAIYNCWSTIDMSATKAAGIALTVENGGNLYNCYYKGKVQATENYGIAKVEGTLKNCFYQMKDGSSAVSNAGGVEKSAFAADELNGFIGAAADALKVKEDTLCKFLDVEGEDFVFVGGCARLEKFTLSYTCYDGSTKTEDVKGFDEKNTAYNLSLDRSQYPELDPDQPIVMAGEAKKTEGTAKVTGSKVILDAKGFGTASVVVNVEYKTEKYTTTSTNRYEVMFAGPASGQPRPTATMTATPIVTPTLTPTQKPTQTPSGEQNSVPNMIPSNAPTFTPTAVPTATPKSMLDCMVVGIEEKYSYSGKAIKADLLVIDGSDVLDENKDYIVTYSGNVKLGEATVVIQGIGNYMGSLTRSFRVVARSISSMKFSKVSNKKYTGKKICPSVVVKSGTRKLVKNKDYKITYKKNIKKGLAKIIITGKGNYTGKKVITFKIK